ncbi:unnamed protein product [Linum trigynum]|uniref:Uncharacterized protein n=1 Tax=Linum trigynum TaxID=586398 RepID=A0AAV2CWN2_9ROSI
MNRDRRVCDGGEEEILGFFVAAALDEKLLGENEVERDGGVWRKRRRGLRTPIPVFESKGNSKDLVTRRRQC